MRPIDADALKRHMGIEDAVKYGNETEEQQHNSYATLMNYEISDFVDDMPTLDYAPKWISVKDRLPNIETPVLCFDEIERMIVLQLQRNERHGKVWMDDYAQEINLDWVTHWMPLPEPPKEENK